MSALTDLSIHNAIQIVRYVSQNQIIQIELFRLPLDPESEIITKPAPKNTCVTTYVSFFKTLYTHEMNIHSRVVASFYRISYNFVNTFISVITWTVSLTKVFQLNGIFPKHFGFGAPMSTFGPNSPQTPLYIW